MKENSISFYGDLFIKQKLDFPQLQEDNLSVINLEAPVTTSSRRYPGKVNLSMKEQVVGDSFDSKKVVFSLGNNHIMDCMEEGFEDTVRFLEAEGYSHFGAGHLENFCNNPIKLKVGSKSVALINVVSRYTSPVFADDDKVGVLDLKHFNEVYAAAKRQSVDKVVAIIHWGAEEIAAPAPYDVKFAHALVDMGVDLIIGHHSHCIQTLEKYRGKYIFYGLGNFAFAPLHESSYFDESGRSQRIYIKKGSPWNFKSFRVTYHVEDGTVKLYLLKFDGKRSIVTKEVAVEDYVKTLNEETYAKTFKYALIKSKVRVKLHNFINEPKLPSIKQIASALKIFKRKEFK